MPASKAGARTWECAGSSDGGALDSSRWLFVILNVTKKGPCLTTRSFFVFIERLGVYLFYSCRMTFSKRHCRDPFAWTTRRVSTRR